MNTPNEHDLWKIEAYSEAPIFPAWFCFKSPYELYNFSLCTSVDLILNGSKDLTQIPDPSERIIDSNGDIFKLVQTNNIITPKKEGKITFDTFKEIIQSVDPEELNAFVPLDQIEDFITKNQIA
ncbi:hypothetical protein N9Q76_01720 [Flavobacteriales bacterium]|nr:hypothetical protein [Flavobacteriales bacterium]